MKKAYNAPKLTVHGDVEVLTQNNGTSFVDVPQGTPVGDGNVAS
ncbi:MAG: lasso peptide [Pleurocapsa sp. MO_192.B19]|nr:lasso peptide [Pleurocapsa sp. MO_192.B19]